MDPQNNDGFYAKFIQSQSVDNLSVMGIPVVAAENVNRPPLQTTAKGSTKKYRGDNFSDEEDIILVNGWLSISVDGIVGTEQKLDNLWDIIHAYYHECKKPTHQERSKHSLGNRWSIIQASVNKFCACLTQIEKLNAGNNEADKVDKAYTTYKNDWGANFTFSHCWKILRYHPKWILQKDEARTQKRKCAPGAKVVASVSVDIGDEDVPKNMDECERPAGKKALKAEERKRKYQEEKSALFEKVMSSLKEERKQQHEEKMKKIDKLSQIEKKKGSSKGTFSYNYGEEAGARRKREGKSDYVDGYQSIGCSGT